MQAFFLKIKSVKIPAANLLAFFLILFFVFAFSGLFQRLDNWAVDQWFNLRLEHYQKKEKSAGDSWLFPAAPSGNNIILLVIDDTSILSVPGLFKVDRSVFARALRNLKAAQPKVVGLDVFFPSPDLENPEADLELVEAIKDLGNVVVKAYRRDNRRMTPPFPQLARSTTYAPTFFSSSGGDTIRKVSLYFTSENDDLAHCFQLEILKKYWGLADDSVKIEPENVSLFHNGRHINFPITDYEFLQLNFDRSIFSFKTLSFADLYHNLIAPELLRDKIVIIGYGNSMTEEKYFTPIATKVFSPYLHGLTLTNLMHEKGVRVTSTLSNQVVAVVFLILSHFCIFPFFTSPLIIVFAVIITALLIFASLILLSVYNFQLGVSACVFVTLASMLFSVVQRYYLEFSEKNRIKHAFQHYVTASVVNEILKDPSKLNLHGEEKNLTVFFSDIEGFTSLSEGMSPLDVVSLLNEYLSEMTEIIFKFEGLLDKYEGDAIMAVFGAPVNQSDHAVKACRCALENQKALARLREKWKKEGKPEFKARIGINTGEVVVGNMGSKMRFDYTVIGDNVNLASRLETANKIMDTEILVSESTALLAASDIISRCLGKLKVAGKVRHVSVYEVLADKNSDDKEELEQAEAKKQAYENAYAEFKLMNFVSAETILKKHLEIFANDSPAINLLEKARGFQVVPPPPNWEDIITQETK